MNLKKARELIDKAKDARVRMKKVEREMADLKANIKTADDLILYGYKRAHRDVILYNIGDYLDDADRILAKENRG